MTGDVLTTARDSERVEKGGDEDETREARQLRDPDEVLHVGKGDRPKEGARSREGKRKGTRVKERGGKQATEIVCCNLFIRSQTRGDIYSSQCHKR
jgi:hypothetical protein